MLADLHLFGCWPGTLEAFDQAAEDMWDNIRKWIWDRQERMRESESLESNVNPNLVGEIDPAEIYAHGRLLVAIRKTYSYKSRKDLGLKTALLYEIEQDLLSSSPQYASTSFSASSFGRLISTFIIAANSSSVGISSSSICNTSCGYWL